MARIYDNIETKFAEGLQGIITNDKVKRVDFCVGYFNLRGWNLVVDQVEIHCRGIMSMKTTIVFFGNVDY